MRRGAFVAGCLLLASAGMVGKIALPAAPPAARQAITPTAEELQLIERGRQLKPLVDDFVRLMYVDHKGRDAFNKYVAANLIEHDPDYGDGRDAVFAFIKRRFSGPNAEEYLPIEQWRTYVDQVLIHGDVAIIRTHAFQRRNDKGRVFVNFWRWQGDKIVEHWDVIQDVPRDKANPRDMWSR